MYTLSLVCSSSPQSLAVYRLFSFRSAVSQARPAFSKKGKVSICSLASEIHFLKKGKGLVNCVYREAVSSFLLFFPEVGPALRDR